jgi:hypothetical protein
MDFFGTISDLLGESSEIVGDRVVTEVVYEKIKMTTFIDEAITRGILIKKVVMCKKTENGWLSSNEVDDNTNIKDIYTIFYNHLVDRGIFKKTTSFTFFLIGDALYTIDPSKIKEIEIHIGKLPESMKCYSIDYIKLRELLKKYEKLPDNISSVLKQKKGGKTQNKRKRKNKGKRKNKTQRI